MDKKVIGIIIFVVLIAIIVGVTIGVKTFNKNNETGENKAGLETVYVATGGGKENFIADENVKKILEKKYKLNIVYDNWSNGKTITWPLIRESVGQGDSNLANTLSKDHYAYSITSDGVSKYDALFTSDQRFYDYYKLTPDSSKEESNRYRVLDGDLTLNTPIVIYSWGEVVDKLVEQGIVVQKDNVYYIQDMNKLIQYILNGTKWSDIGLNIYGNVNIASTDPITSSPGATYYGLLLSIMCGGEINDANIDQNLPKLKEFYEKSGYMNNTPADLFQKYLKMGMGAEPMIVDYEKSIIDFANSHSEQFDQVKDQIRILYPVPTIWNSHCIATFNEKGNNFLHAFDDSEIQDIAWNKYGFRTGVTGGTYDVSKFGIGVPQNVTSTVSSLKMDYYNKLIEYLEKK